MKKRQYDLTLIIKGNKTVEEAGKIFEDIKAKLEKIGFQIDKTINPTFKELAYEINKIKQGYYVTFILSSDNFNAKDLQEIFKFDENILRFLVVEYSDSVGLRKQKHDRRTRKYQDEKQAAAKIDTQEYAIKEEIVQTKDKEEIVAESSKSEEESTSEEINQPKEESTAQKQIDLEDLDEKLDELLK